MNPTELRRNLYQVLDAVLETGHPVHVERKGRLIRIEPVGNFDRLAGLDPHENAVAGDPYDLDEIGWSEAWKP